MTRSQIDALKLQEEQRHNKEQEGVQKKLIPAQYLSAIGSILRGSSGFIKTSNSKPKSKWKATQSGMNDWTIY